MKTAEKLLQKVENGTIISPKGFFAGGIHAGLRFSKKDVGVIVSEKPASCAAVYTQNHFQAAPLKVTQESIEKSNKLQAVVVNSANANACTGEQGLQDAYEMRYLVAKRLNMEENLIAVASTGVIGEFLKMDKIKYGIEHVQFTSTYEGAAQFQEAILTTDTFQKSSCYEIEIEGKKVLIGGAAKGSGMIHPNMATMLAFVTTDANIPSPLLQKALKEVTDKTFNQITVDGDTSTNDMVLVLANGEAGHQPLTEEHPDWGLFKEGLKEVCEDLAKQIARDGEGATKLVEVNVNGAKSKEAANVIAKQIVGSSLVKTAIYGTDVNWGRIICAVGYSQADINPAHVEIFIGPYLMFKEGVPQPFSEEEAKNYLENETVTITVNLKDGTENGKAWGCDLTYDYVKINASYRT
ncbi:bifunctional ornithine acetyltransferase/N-acetylglutamate synthase [Bacillus sp. FJAT-47783]|uniref:bifunctional ornithine acetyltransferase/N-acetylglutamate synthase n=1 Tax=Bacillus sp. FJAT-47783 TaxID=2922712 RepID=UPI001FAE4999|nr:bifunctional ornithine acetyltransferase/N-acetylglutamate synthase [Bacillus sp. FJAT-47783]